MKKNTAKIMSGVAGATILLSGYANLTPEQEKAQKEPASVSQTEASNLQEEYEVNGYRVEASVSDSAAYKKVANVEGSFLFSQDVLSPADDMFNIFGTVVTGVCASPAFTTERSANEEHYLNISGNLKKQYTVKVQEAAKENSESRVLKCSCATGGSVANVQVIGVPLSAVIRMDELEDGVNTVTVRGSDGYGLSLPLTYALEKKAMIVYGINGEDVPSGTQFWVPETVARYFTRDVVSIELTAEEEVPKVQGPADEYRAKVNVLNTSEGCTFQAGQEIVFEGYADDCGSSIVAVEFSMDGGETWTAYETEGATADKWVFWNFCYTPEEAGVYQLTARARTADGVVSPLASSLLFTVE